MIRNMPAGQIPAAYWATCLEDERQLAPFLGWGRLRMPVDPVPNAWIWGSNHAEFKSHVGPEVISHGEVTVPRWRRDRTAMGELLEHLPANVLWDKDRVSVWVGWKDGQPARPEDLSITFFQKFADHPTNGHALRKALVDLAIAYLGNRRKNQGQPSRQDLQRPQLSDWSVD